VVKKKIENHSAMYAFKELFNPFNSPPPHRKIKKKHESK